MIPTALIGVGVLVITLSFFPLSAASWLGRDVQLLVGVLIGLAGLVLVEVKGMVEKS